MRLLLTFITMAILLSALMVSADESLDAAHSILGDNAQEKPTKPTNENIFDEPDRSYTIFIVIAALVVLIFAILLAFYKMRKKR